MQDIKLYSVSEAANYLRININTLNNLIHNRQIKYICLGSNKIRQEWLDEFIETNSTNTPNSNKIIKINTTYWSENDELYTIKEVSKILRMNINDTNNLINAHLLQCTTFGHRKVTKNWINNFLESNIYQDFSNRNVKAMINNDLDNKEAA